MLGRGGIISVVSGLSGCGKTYVAVELQKKLTAEFDTFYASLSNTHTDDFRAFRDVLNFYSVDVSDEEQSCPKINYDTE